MNQPTAPATSASFPTGAPADTATADTGSASLSRQATQWLGQVPGSLKGLGSQATAQYQKLSTTQKVVGGALLAVAVGALLTGKKKDDKRARKSAKTLHELLLFVNDRIEGYQRAVDLSHDAQLRSYYQRLAGQSRQFSSQLNNYLGQQDGGHEDGTTLKGKLYRRWMDAKATVTGSDEGAILEANIYGEEWALKAYEEALKKRTLVGPVRETVERQYALSQQTYRELKQKKARQAA